MKCDIQDGYGDIGFADLNDKKMDLGYDYDDFDIDKINEHLDRYYNS